jgi:hypothetical protein
MAIARKPGSNAPAASKERAAETFIASAGQPAMPSPVPEVVEERRRVPTMIRFDSVLLERVDQAARRRGVSRSAWVAFTLSRALDEEGAA